MLWMSFGIPRTLSAKLLCLKLCNPCGTKVRDLHSLYLFFLLKKIHGLHAGSMQAEKTSKTIPLT